MYINMCVRVCVCVCVCVCVRSGGASSYDLTFFCSACLDTNFNKISFPCLRYPNTCHESQHITYRRLKGGLHVQVAHIENHKNDRERKTES